MTNCFTVTSLSFPRPSFQNTPLTFTDFTQISRGAVRQAAGNPQTRPELLRQLANSGDAVTRLKVAGNPNTPTEVLLSLGAEFPQQLLANPVFSLLLLEDPHLVAQMPLLTLRNVVKLPQAPLALLTQAASTRDQEVLLALVRNPKTPASILKKLTGHSDAEVRNAACLHVNLAGELVRDWQEVAKEAIQTTPLTFQDWQNLHELAQVNLRFSEGNCTLKFLQDFLSEIDVNFRQTVHPTQRNLGKSLTASSSSAEIEEGTPSLRLQMAFHKKTPIFLLELLAKDLNPEVRCAVAKNPKTPQRTLEQLARDKNWQIRQAVALNPHTPGQVLESLAQEKFVDVRTAVAANPSTPAAVLQFLATEQYFWVATLTAVAANPNSPASVLRQLAYCCNIEVREVLATHPNLPANLLGQLATDKDERVRVKVAGHPLVPKATLEGLLKDKIVKVRTLAVKRYLATNPQDLATVLATYTKIFSPSLSRVYLFSHLQMPAGVLAEQSQSLFWLERYVIAAHPKTPIKTLQALAEDGNRVVRATAKANLKTRKPA